MIYRLNDEFTKVEEKDGVIQNKSCHAMIEVVTTDGMPEKDTGISLKPREKLAFSVETGKSLYARCECLEFSGANLAVVNFKKPASGGEGAGGAVGSIVYGHFVLPGYVKSAGQLLKRDDYPELYACAVENNLVLPEVDWANGMQGMYGEGDGSTTFRVPDLRGQFLRAVDDGAGLDADRVLGSAQGDAIRNITGSYVQSCENAGVVSGIGGHWGDGAFLDDISVNSRPYAIPCSNRHTGLSAGVSFDASRVVATAEENRPKNVALIAQIKY